MGLWEVVVLGRFSQVNICVGCWEVRFYNCEWVKLKEIPWHVGKSCYITEWVKLNEITFGGWDVQVM
jgi:hypothetical protein